MIKHRVEAFTIMELVIAMLITAILIGITYSSYLIVSKSYISFRVKNDAMSDLTRLDEWLRKDFNRADSIVRDTGGIALTGKERFVHYRFIADGVIRNAARADTFKFKVDSVVADFESKPIEQFNPVPELNRIDELQFIILFNNEKIPYHYYKSYSSVDLINRNPNAIH